MLDYLGIEQIFRQKKQKLNLEADLYIGEEVQIYGNSLGEKVVFDP